MSVNGKLVCPPVWMGHEKPTPVYSVAIQSFCWRRQILIPLIFFQIKLPLHWAKRAGTHSNGALTTSVSHKYKYKYKYRICNIVCLEIEMIALNICYIKRNCLKPVHILKFHSTELHYNLKPLQPTLFYATSILQISVHMSYLLPVQPVYIKFTASDSTLYWFNLHFYNPFCVFNQITDLIHIFTTHTLSSTNHIFITHIITLPLTYTSKLFLLPVGSCNSKYCPQNL